MFSGCQAEAENEVWSNCIKYVEMNLKAIKGRAKKFIPYGGAYDMDDFLQEAFFCAKKAVNDCPLQCNTCGDEFLECETYPIIFWGIIRDRFSKMANWPSLEKLYGTGSKMPAQTVDIESYNAKLTDETDILNCLLLGESDFNEDAEREFKISKALSLMNPQSRKAWEYHLGKNGCGRALSRKEITEKMNFSHPQRVSQLLNRGLLEAREKIADLRRQIVTREVTRMEARRLPQKTE